MTLVQLVQILLKDVRVLSVIRVSTEHKGENLILIFFSVGLQFSPQDILKFNDAVGLSAVQLLFHKVSCEALRATRTKQINHFCEAFERPLS